MKKFLLILIFLKIACDGYTQTNSGNRPIVAQSSRNRPAIVAKEDTMCLPISEVQKSFRIDDSLQIMKREVDSAFSLIRVQQKFLLSKDSTIRDLRIANLSALNVISAKQQGMENALQQRDLQREDMRYFQNLYRKQRSKSFWTGFAGVVGIVGTIFIMK